MKSWWQNLNKRERNLVLLAAILASIALAWTLVWKPLARYHTFLQQDLQDARDIRAQMQQQRTAIARLQSSPDQQQPAQGGSLDSTVNHLLKQHQLDGAGTSSEEQDRDTVALKLDGKPFDNLIRFLAQMESQHATHATSMTLKPAEATGLVDAQITLQR